MRGEICPRAVVFDFDGTVIDSLSLVLQAIGHAIEPFGPRPQKEILAQLGGPPERFLTAMLADVTEQPTALRRMNDFHRDHADMIRPFDGARHLLERLKTQAHLAIWTGRDRVSTERLMAEHDLAHLFSVVLCGDDLPTHKPDPAGLREIIRRLGVGTNETIFVGDADVDVLGGAACGVATVLIQHGREVDPAVAAQSWRRVETPLAALETVLRCFASDRA